MFFAKEMNYLSTRMMVLSKASALVDAIYVLLPRVFENIGDLDTASNHAKDFDDMEFKWHVPDIEELLEYCRKKMADGEGFYETTIRLAVSQETARSEEVENSLNTAVRVFVSLSTIAFDSNEEPIEIDGSHHGHDIDIVIEVDKNGAHINDHLSSVDIALDKYKDLIKDEPAVSREQLAKFFDGVLKAIDDVNGNDGDGYMLRHYDKYINKYGVSFDEDDYYYFERIMEEDEEE